MTRCRPARRPLPPAPRKRETRPRTESRTLGAFLEQRLAFRDRLFVTGAIRSDRNSAFGADFKTVFYPKFSVSWVLSEEPFFPAAGWMDQFRFRAAYGASGVQPGTTDAVPFYLTARTIGESGEASGVVFTALGNTSLKPERSTEMEVGVDGSFWGNRLSAELTYYHKVSKDALVQRTLPPSLGTGGHTTATGGTSRFENLGEVRNRGLGGAGRRAAARSQCLRLAADTHRLDERQQARLAGWHSADHHQQHAPAGRRLPPQRLVVAPPDELQRRQRRRQSSRLSEITVSDSVEFHGNSAPGREAAITNTFSFLQQRLRLSAMMDYRGDYMVYNNTERIRCAQPVQLRRPAQS